MTKTKIVSAPLSDHQAITLSLNTTECERGPGFWKMNVSILENDIFDRTFLSFWESWKDKIKDHKSKKIWWELAKLKIKELSIEIAKQISKTDNIK